MNKALETKIILDFPVELDGVEVKEVTIRRAKVKDHKNANRTSNGDSSDYEMHLFAALIGQPVDFFDEMDYADYQKVQKEYQAFLSL